VSVHPLLNIDKAVDKMYVRFCRLSHKKTGQPRSGKSCPGDMPEPPPHPAWVTSTLYWSRPDRQSSRAHLSMGGSSAMPRRSCFG